MLHYGPGYNDASDLIDLWNAGVRRTRGLTIALGALRAVTDRGFRVPLDISIVGFDGVDVSQYSVPRLTTVRQDTGLLARRGVEALLAATRGEKGRVMHESVPFRLLRRESVLSLLPATPVEPEEGRAGS